MLGEGLQSKELRLRLVVVQEHLIKSELLYLYGLTIFLARLLLLNKDRRFGTSVSHKLKVFKFNPSFLLGRLVVYLQLHLLALRSSLV